MKTKQLDIFGGNLAFEEPADLHRPKGVKRKRTRKQREAKKAPMLVDAFVSEIQNSEIRIQKSDEAKPKTEDRKPKTENREPETAPGPYVFTVSELTSKIKGLLEDAMPDIWVSGEVTDFRNRNGRHLYFSVKDEQSKLRIIYFNADSQKVPFELKDGLEVVCHGKLNVYAPQGNYSLVIDYLEPKGIGALQLAFEQLKKKLETEGLFDAARKKPLPFLPRRIGVVTSPTGAAIRDIVHVLGRRFPNVEILLYPVRVQGDGAAAEIANAIGALNLRSDLDLLIIGRGGGSIEDLWAFNEEIVARAIAASRLPTISAVGHEIDFTIADFVADKRAATPSVAAEIAVPKKEDLLVYVSDFRRRLSLALSQIVTNRGHETKRLAERLIDPRKKLPDLFLRVDGLRQRLAFAARVGIEKHSQVLLKLASNLNHLSPLGVLAKGYAVVEGASGAVVRSSVDVHVGDAISVRLYKGRIGAKVISN